MAWEIEVHSQKEFDDVSKEFDGVIVIKNTIEIISVVARENSRVVAWGNSSVEARGNSSVEARENSRVVAWGNSSVEARENSRVVAWGNSRVVARGNSSVEAWGNSRVEARGNSSVVAWENSSVEAWGNSSVEAWRNSSVVAWENSSVEAWGNSSVEAWGNSSVEAWRNSSVVAWENSHGKAFDNSRILLCGTGKWEKYMNAVLQKYVEPLYTKKLFLEIAEKKKDKVVLYKSVNPDTLRDFYTGTIEYTIGSVVECPDFDPNEDRECGGGLHLSYTARKTQDFNQGKILKCLVDPEDIVVYEKSIEKVRCRKVLPVAVVDINGKPIKEV
jgi:hypothetical protein